MSNKKELNKYRKKMIKEIPYISVYADGVIETKQGYFTKTYCDNVLKIFDTIHGLSRAPLKMAENMDEERKQLTLDLANIDSQITYFNKMYYVTIGIKKNSYEEAQNIFGVMDNLFRPLSFMERMYLLHAMYQNDDNFYDRFIEYSTKKGEEPDKNIYTLSDGLEDKLKAFKKNRKISKDLIIPKMLKATADEIEYEGNYIRFFYLKDMPRYVTEEFLKTLTSIEDVTFSLHFQPLNQEAILKYTDEKFRELKDPKDSDLLQKDFFESASYGLERSGIEGEEMFLATLVLGVADDSIDELDRKMKKLIRQFENTYVVKSLRFQQHNAFQTLLPFCNDRMDIKSTIFKKKS